MTESSKPPSGRRMKVHAPPPPQVPQPAPRNLFRNSVPDGGGTSAIDAKENLLRPTVDFQLTLPQGYQISVTEDGSKALMDLLVELCSRHQLNPALHTLELLSPEGHPLGFKPNALLGSLNVACVLIKERVTEEKLTRRPAPKVPEKTKPVKPVRARSKKTVRLMVNYHSNQKAVARVNPLVPLHALIPVICDKCDFDPEHVLLLKDCVGRHELPLDQSLSELGIKELYVHDKSLDSICSSTTSLGRPQKKGILNLFQFSRRKSKTETRSMNMDDFDDDTIHNTDTTSNGLSTASGVSNMEVRPSCLGQSQSVTDIPGMSSRGETKKRRAPAPPGAPTPSLGQVSLKADQVGPGSETQRKRKAPAPPPTPISITQDSDDSSAPAALGLDHHTSEIPTPARRNKVAQSTVVSDVSVVAQTAKPSPHKRTAQPSPVCDAYPTPSSPSPSSSTTDSMAVQDSSSELGHSLDDSDDDLEQGGSFCSTSSTASGSVQVQTTTKDSSGSPGQKTPDVDPGSSSRSDMESALNLKVDEVENNRHSGMVWLHSAKSSSSVQKQEPAALEAETLSLDSSSVGSSLPDQGYPLPEGMAEGEDSGIVSSPSDTQPTSPDGSLSVDGRPEDRGETLLEPQKDTSSDSDEGCAAWRQKERHDTSPQEQSVNSFEDGSQLTVQLHQTLADMEADLADHTNIASLKDTSFTKSTDSNDVPVSLVDMYVPVTAIDELLEDYECNIVEHEGKSLANTASAGSKDAGFSQQSDVEPQNKNNNAYTAAVGYRRSSKNTKKSEQSNKPQENQLTGVKKEEKIQNTKTKEIPDINIVKEDKETLAVKSNADIQKNFRTTEINPELVKNTPQTLQQQKPNLSSAIQRSLPAEINKEIQRASQTNSSFNSPHGKITHNVTSRFGMKTFTVVPPKPSTMHPTQSAATVSNGAIKIDDQGNMVTAGVSHNKVSRLSESENSQEVTLREKAKAFWCSNEKQENAATQRKGLIDKTKDSMNGLSSAPPTVGLEAKLRTMHSAASEPAKTFQSKEETKEPVKDATVANTKRVEVESKSSALNSVQMPSKPALPPPLPSDLKKQLNFLKPSRRTSSQYVASAIAKYTSDKPTSISKVPDSSKSLKTQTAAGFQRSGPATQVTQLPSSQSSLSDNNSSAHIISGPNRPMSPSEYVSDSRRDFGEVKLDKEGFQKCAVSKESSDVLNTETAKSNHSQHNGAIQKCATANNNKDYIKHVQPRSCSPPKNGALHPSFKPPVAPKFTSQDHINGTKDTNKDMNSQSSASDSNVAPEPEPVPVTVFGPVQRFKPVICKSIEKETSLHSSLMEAIQTGGGRDRLKKISTSPCNQRKVTLIEDENERSALLAAIRAQNNINRLKKTKSEAAGELEQFRKVTSDEERNAGSAPSPPSLTCSSPGFTSPPSPPMFSPPPPPPILPQGKPNSVVQINTNTPINPASAREAMLEAIRSGAGAEKLKKVSVPSKTIHVNGRLGTIQATVPQH